MPFVVDCPRCATRLKSGQPIPAGRAVSCPMCKLVFTLSQPAAAAEAPAPAVPAPPPLPVRTKAPEQIPAAVILEDDDFDDPDPPPPRPRRLKPAPHDRPRDRWRRELKRNPALLVLIGGGAGLVLLLLLVGGILLIADPFNWRGGPPGELLAWAPADSTGVVYMDVEALRKHEKVRNSMKSGLVDRLGLKADEVSAVLMAGKTFGGLDGEVTAVRLHRAPDRDQLVRSVGGTEATANGKTYYRTKDGGGMYFPGGRVVVLTRSTATMNALLQKPDGKVVISDDLRAVTDRGRGQMWIASVMPGGGPFGPGLPGLPGGGGPQKSMVLSFTLSGDTGEVQAETTYADPDTARRMAADWEWRRTQFEASGQGKYTITTRGATVITTMTGPVTEGKGMFPF